METKTLLKRVRRAVWRMEYADDAAIVSRFSDGLAMMTVVVRAIGVFD